MFERCLFFNLNALVRQVDKLWNEAFQAFDLSPAHAYLLRLVLAQPTISQHQIATELRLEKSTVTRFVDALQAKGYVRRKRLGREQQIVPTAAARRLEQALSATGDALYARMLSTLGQDDLLQLVRSLRQAAEKLS